MKEIIENKKNLIKIIDRLISHKHDVYFVGGMVRDFLLGRPIHDFDLTTSALPSEIVDLFSDDYKLVLKGLKHGTVSIISGSEMFEVTTFRTEGGYLDNRHPSSISFVKNIYEDLLRRDFTINALAINANDYSKVIDYFGGLNDLNNKIIRTVNNSEIRLTEDALRILRGLRFSSVLGFKIEEETKKSIFKHYELLNNISKERITEEIKQMIDGDYFSEVFIEYYDIFSFLLDLDDNKINKDLICNNIKFLNSFASKLSLFMYYSNNPLKVLRNLRFSNKIYYNIKNVLDHVDKTIDNDIDIRNIFRVLSNSDTLDLVNLKRAIDYNNKDKYYDLYYRNVNKCNRIKNLNIDGNDLLKLGIFKRRIGFVLNKLLDLVIEDKIENDYDVLGENALKISKSNIY